ncbi:helix-turn-helix domain-containing protein [Gloeobacter violaceus]|uniref:Gll1643 protein n=1 Tax=Gloeobacter violaceus (strain ATCC 29082 / PCC 7421) TaxID=251221 RepID=Q7NK37_GLOVI|nr:DNA-binding transcriptional regulator [Gloeobacter violaceus]BAC89584.1 gll1643 [Gloeobacter violaceus PCC 7421]
MKKKKSSILEAVHKTARGLYEAEAIDQLTMRKFDVLCLPPVPELAPEQIKSIRETARMSQAVFAATLNTSTSTIQKWEVGQKKPSGPALKLLHLVKDRGVEILA